MIPQIEQRREEVGPKLGLARVSPRRDSAARPQRLVQPVLQLEADTLGRLLADAGDHREPADVARLDGAHEVARIDAGEDGERQRGTDAADRRSGARTTAARGRSRTRTATSRPRARACGRAASRRRRRPAAGRRSTAGPAPRSRRPRTSTTRRVACFSTRSGECSLAIMSAFPAGGSRLGGCGPLRVTRLADRQTAGREV